MADLHQHYDQLTDTERAFVDAMFSRESFFQPARVALGFTIAGDDDAERAVDAVAALILASRPRPTERRPKAHAYAGWCTQHNKPLRPCCATCPTDRHADKCPEAPTEKKG